MFINGEWVSTGKMLEVTNPATGNIAYEVHLGGEDEALRAIEAAEAAFSAWADLPAPKRAGYLLTVAEIMEEEKEVLASVITKEMGKPIQDSRSEINKSIDFFRWYAEEAKRIYGETIPHNASDKRLLVTNHPIGVVGAITPWNFPVSMIARKAAPALAAGCTMVVKPASQAPQSAVDMMKIFERAGLPKGVINLVIVPARTVSRVFMESEAVRKITFTGSTEVGKKLYEEAAKTVKRVSLELGGHAPFVVFNDADLDLAVNDIVLAKFRCSGEMCTAANRIYAQEEVFEEFAKKLTNKVKTLKVGNGIEEDTAVGPLIDGRALQKVMDHVDDAIRRGAQVLTGGRVLSEGEFAGGNYVEPTVLTNVNKDMRLYREETFGPVAPLIRFQSEKALINEVNHAQYGLSSYVYTQDMSRAIRMIEKLEYGIVGINDPTPSVVQGPFGGIKESGIGKEGSRHGIDEYLEKKLVSIRFKR